MLTVTPQLHIVALSTHPLLHRLLARGWHLPPPCPDLLPYAQAQAAHPLAHIRAIILARQSSASAASKKKLEVFLLPGVPSRVAP